MRWRMVMGVAAAAVVLGVGSCAWASRPPRWGTLARATVTRDSTFEQVTLVSTTGRSLACTVRPAAEAGRRRAVVLAGGIETGQRAVRLLPASFTDVAMACDYVWADLLDAGVRRLPRLRGGLVATPDALRMAAAYLRSRPDVDSARVAGIGVSVGVPLVSAWAGRDSTVRAVALLYGGADLAVLFDLILRRHVRPSWLRAGVARSFAAWVRPLEPSRTVGGIAPRPLLIVGSRGDQRVPVASIELLERAARPPARMVWLEGVHLHPTEEGLLRTLIDTTRVWLDEVMP